MADTPIIPNPLHDLHRQAEAEFQAWASIEIVSTFGEPQAEYAAIHKGCALVDLPQRGVIEVSGKDRLPFLNNLISNEVYSKQTKTGIAAGRGVYAFLLNAKSGRIITDVNVLELGDRTLLELESRLIEPILQALDRYLFAEQVKLAPKLGELHEVALHGPTAIEILNEALDAPLTSALDDPMSCAATRIIGQDVVVWRDDPAGVPGYHLIVPTSAARSIWMHLITTFGQPHSDQLAKRRLRAAGWAAFNAARIEAGRAMFGIDFDDSVLPLETNQVSRAISFTKGCYPGQEIVARMHARQQVARQLVGIRMEDDGLPLAGAQVLDKDGNTIGGITSSTLSPVLSNAAICLGFVRKPHYALGTKLTIPAEGKMRTGTVVETPFK